MPLPELVIEDEPEAKPVTKVLTERAKVEEEMKRWEKEQQKVEKLNKQLMSFEVGISQSFQLPLEKPKSKFEPIPDETPVL